ncbi:hypothetical protein MRB53_035826 [Persea americana]|uniref:Uncharacterized protein n=1 Tax=Persea americana TaxID=3435 RepID=A0ACC2K661_PERAE|nr:hypothetical protein MRB53_035826 [Persea americana]
MDSVGFHAAASSLRQTPTEPKIAPAVRRRNGGSDFGRTSPNLGKSIKNRTFFSGSSSGFTLFRTGGVITRCQPKQERRDNLSLLRRAITVFFDRDPHNLPPGYHNHQVGAVSVHSNHYQIVAQHMGVPI